MQISIITMIAEKFPNEPAPLLKRKSLVKYTYTNKVNVFHDSRETYRYRRGHAILQKHSIVVEGIYYC